MTGALFSPDQHVRDEVGAAQVAALFDFVDALREMGVLPKPRAIEDVSGPTKQRVLG